MAGSPRGGTGGRALRAALVSGTTAALVFAMLGSAAAATVHRKPAHVRHEAKKKEPPPKPLQLPLIEVSIADQRLTLFDKGELVATAPVSTGMPGHLTPTGVFSVLEKEVFHRSNIYSGAPMPFMQRITWSGVAIHAGVLPGYPASHGCIRMPPAFAVKLFHMTERGARVLVMHNEVTPVAFENPRLFTRPKPADKLSELVASPAPAAKPVALVRTAETQIPNVLTDAVDAPHAAAAPKPEAPAVAPMKAAEPPAAPSGADETAKDKPVEKPTDQAKGAARDTAKNAGAPAVSDTAAKDNAAPPAAADTAPAPVKPMKDAAAPPPPATTDAPAATLAAPKTAPAAAATGTVLVKPVPVTASQPVEVNRTFAPAAAAPAVAPAVAPAAAPAPAVKASLQPYGPERPLRPGPITVFISKKEGKLFVRKAFQPVFSAPVSILHPEQPLGTHLFTAVEQNADGVSFSWLEVTLPAEHVARKRKEVVHYVTVKGRKVRKVEKVEEPAPAAHATAAEALDRIEIPQAARERIEAMMSPGASVIISDQGISYETGSETDFIVLTSSNK